MTEDIAVAQGLIVGLGQYEGNVEVDMTGKIVCPGFIDAHIHLESSLVTPSEFARAVLPHGRLIPTISESQRLGPQPEPL